MPGNYLAKVGVVGSNPIARSKFLFEIKELAAATRCASGNYRQNERRGYKGEDIQLIREKSGKSVHPLFLRNRTSLRNHGRRGINAPSSFAMSPCLGSKDREN